MMIDSVVLAQHDRHTDTYVAMVTYRHVRRHGNTQTRTSPWQHTDMYVAMATHRHVHRHGNTQTCKSPWQHTDTYVAMATHRHVRRHGKCCAHKLRRAAIKLILASTQQFIKHKNVPDSSIENETSHSANTATTDLIQQISTRNF